MAQMLAARFAVVLLCGTGVFGQTYPTGYMYSNCGSSIAVSGTGYISWRSTGDYINYADCVVVLSSPIDTIISLQFPNVDIEGGASCIDYLYIYNGAYYSPPGFYSASYVCNNNVLSGFLSTNSYVTLRLKTDGSVTGSFQVLYSVHNSNPRQASDRVRLVGGSTPDEGRLEVRPADTYDWGTVCDDSFDTADAVVACRTLGYVTALEYHSSAEFGEGSGPIYMDDLACSGTESSLFDCSYRGWGAHNCGHGEDVGVVCTSAASADRIRLVGGSTASEGRVEVRPIDSYDWGTVCDDHFDIEDASVVCRSLGYSGAHSFHGSESFGPGSGDIYMDDVACSGTEISLFDCPYAGWGVENCGHSEDVGVVCRSSGQSATTTRPGVSDRIRLVGGPVASAGRLEVRSEDGYDWGTICDDSFDTADATVACRMLGYTGAAQVHDAAYYGQGSGNIYMDNLECTGSESSLFVCSHSGWGNHNCGHSEDVGVECSTLAIEQGLSGGAIAGIILGVFGGISLLVTFIYCACKSTPSNSVTNRVIPTTQGHQNMGMTTNTVLHHPTVVIQNPPYNPQHVSTVYPPYSQPPQYPPPPAYTDALRMPTQPPTAPTSQPPPTQLYPPNDPAYPATYLPPH